VISILNKLTLQKKLQHSVTNNVLDNKVKHKMGIEPGTSRNQIGCVTTAPPGQLRVMIVIKLFNCFEALVQNINKQRRISGPHIFNI